ncbi:hypothetical protein FKM82_009934 [Ascaphus truei]
MLRVHMATEGHPSVQLPAVTNTWRIIQETCYQHPPMSLPLHCPHINPFSVYLSGIALIRAACLLLSRCTLSFLHRQWFTWLHHTVTLHPQAGENTKYSGTALWL